MSAVAMFGNLERLGTILVLPHDARVRCEASTRRLVYLPQLLSLLNGSDESDSYLEKQKLQLTRRVWNTKDLITGNGLRLYVKERNDINLPGMDMRAIVEQV